MYKTFIETSGSTLLYESDVDLNEYFIKNANFMDFPGLKLIDESDYESELKVIYHDSLEEKVLCTDDCIEIFFPFSELTEASIAYMGYILMEKERAEKSMVTLHSACVQKDDGAILILGRAGSGKTTTVIDLCTNHDFELIGNDRNVIGIENDQLIVYNGTKYLFLRYESILRNLPHLINHFPEKNGDSWLNKVKILPEEVNIKTCDNPIAVKKSYLVHVDNTKEDLVITDGENGINRLYLNEILSMYIRGIYTTFCDKNFRARGYIKSYDCNEYYNKRTKIIDKILEESNLEYISGNVNDMTYHIAEKHKQLVLKR